MSQKFAVVYRTKKGGPWKAANRICGSRDEAKTLARDETQFAFDIYETAVAYLGDVEDWQIEIQHE